MIGIPLNMGKQCKWKRKSLRKIQPIEVVNEEIEMEILTMGKHRLLAKDYPNSGIVDEPPINDPLEQVVDDETIVDLIEVGYSVNETREGMDYLPPHEEVPRVKTHVQQPNVL